MDEPLKILIVCLGNICRSPMAEGALRARIERAGLGKRLLIDSAGTGAWHVGQPPDSRSMATAKRHGVDISDLRARQLIEQDYWQFDWILCADHDNLRTVLQRAPDLCTAKTGLLLEWAGTGDTINDPYTGTQDDFETVWQQVDQAAIALIQRYAGQSAGMQSTQTS